MSRPARGRRRRRPPSYPWASLPDEELLDLRFRDLGLRIDGTALEQRVERLHRELEAKGLRFRPHVWLSDEWFSPDGIPGIAAPFYLAHPRLMRLERRFMHEVEGGSQSWCMKILRHEAGHALDTAYGLHRRRRWRETFGPYSRPYPDTYEAKPYSRRFVLNLDFWYAQSHPAEDFAETFAVWLRPRSGWRRQYVGWPALKKLEYVDELMHEIADRPPRVRSRRRWHSVAQIGTTLREHYEERRERYGIDRVDFYDRELRRLFADGPARRGQRSAAEFLESLRPQIRGRVARYTGLYRYTVDQVIDEVIERCNELNLVLDRRDRRARTDALIVMTVITMNYLGTGNHQVSM